jgi:membrane associated rhomboid family serine protease
LGICIFFLVVFGDNSEDVLGKGRYLLLIALATFVGHFAQILSDPGSTTPCVGASGGISGILAYYCLRFPRARVGIILFWVRWIRMPVGGLLVFWILLQIITAMKGWIRMPVGGLLVFWILLQIITAMKASMGISSVAVFAHLGGAAVGVLFWLFTRQSFSETEVSAHRRGAP